VPNKYERTTACVERGNVSISIEREIKMKISARNQFSETVNNLGLAVGKPAQVLIKASSVLIGVD
jgi:molybdopterin-binding protein